MPRVVADSDRLTRFLFNKGRDFASGKVKAGAFERPPGDPGLSVFHTQDMGENEICPFGQATRPQQNLKARADFSASAVSSAGLGLDPDDDPPRHVHIIGWPPDSDAQLAVRKILARESTLTMCLVATVAG